MPDSARLTPDKMNVQIPTHSEEFLTQGTDLLGSSLPGNHTAGVLLSAQQPRGIALLLSHCKTPERLNSFSALAEKIWFSTPHFSHFPAFSGRIL